VSVCAWRLLALVASLATVAVPVRAETYRVDDSASVVQTGRVVMKWDGPLPRGGGMAMMSGTMTVLVDLDVSPWLGRNARIYMTLPMQPSGPMTASWTSRGRLLPGLLRAGERTLVYAGPIADARLQDTLRLSVQADGRRLARDEMLDFGFEIDLDAL